MYIVAIAWLYVVFMMSITEQSAVAGVTTFLLYGIFPLTVVLYLMGTPQRKRNRQKLEKLKSACREEIVSGPQTRRESVQEKTTPLDTAPPSGNSSGTAAKD